MAAMIFTDARVFTGGADLSAVSNKAEVEGEYEVKDVTTFTSLGYQSVRAGLGSAKMSAEGFWEAGSADLVDNATWAGFAGVGPWTVTPTTAATVGAVAFFMNAMQPDYMFGGAVGDVAPYKASATSTWPLVRGQIGHPTGTARTTTGVGTSVLLGAVPAGKFLFAAIHVLSVSGTTPSMTVRVESDDNVGFTSAVTVATFTAATAAGGQILRVAGPNTDTYYRLAWTITGTTPSFLFVAPIGIG